MLQQTDNCKGKQVINGDHYTTINIHISIGPSWNIHKCILKVVQKRKATTKKFLTKQLLLA